jgi:hypothetical protein
MLEWRGLKLLPETSLEIVNSSMASIQTLMVHAETQGKDPLI